MATKRPHLLMDIKEQDAAQHAARHSVHTQLEAHADTTLHYL